MTPTPASSTTSILSAAAPAHPLEPRVDASPAPRRLLIVGGATALLAFIAYLDVITGTEFTMAYSYLLPVLLVTWFCGSRTGYAFSVLCASVWFFAETHGAAKYDHWVMAKVNALMRMTFFLFFTKLLSEFRRLSTRLGKMVDDRTTALRRLAAQLSEAEDAERRRLALDIHDGFSQTLSLLKMNLAAALPEAAEASTPRQRIGDSINMVDDLIARSRTLTFDLHPAMLEHLGLGPTLQRYAEQFSRQANVEITVSEDGVARFLATSVVNTVFRSIKELLNNAARHGKARQIVAALHWTETQLRIVVDDDGCGFEPSAILAAHPGQGMGLTAIRERVHSLGGSFRLESVIGEGTRVVLELPLDAGASAMSHSTSKELHHDNNTTSNSAG